MIRLTVRTKNNDVTNLAVDEIIAIDGKPFSEFGSSPPSLTELENRVKMLEAIVQPILDVILHQSSPEPEASSSSPPLPPENPEQVNADGR